MDNREIAERLGMCLGRDVNAVAVKLVRKESEIPTGVPEKVSLAIACGAARQAVKGPGTEYMENGLIIGIPGETLEPLVSDLGQLGSVKKRLAGA